MDEKFTYKKSGFVREEVFQMIKKKRKPIKKNQNLSMNQCTRVIM